jgi:tetratricopeptide (TPR) repeat protein
MRRLLVPLLSVFLLMGSAASQDRAKPSEKDVRDSQNVPRSDRSSEAEESSSRDTKIDITPPKDDAKNHPNSASAMESVEEKAPSDGVQEFRPWNPLKALKDVEVGDFYFKRKNYRAALDRYKEALYYKENDAIATFRLAQCQEKLGSSADARSNYEAYLRILPEGPFALDAQKAIDRLSGASDSLSGKKN